MHLKILQKGMRLALNNQTVVIFNKQTKEIVACIPLVGEQAICRKNIDFKIYNGTEPIFMKNENNIVLNENALILNIKERGE